MSGNARWSREEEGARGWLSSTVREWLPPLGLVAGFLLVWQAATAFLNTPEWFLPSPTSIGQTMVSSWGLLSQHALVTLEEVLVGFLVAFLIGIVLAAGITFSRTIERAVYPFIVASQTVPVVAIAPLLLIWFGYGLLPKVIVVALICFFPIVVNTVDGLRSVDPDLVNLMRSMGASRRQIFTKAQFPSALPFVFSGTKVAIAVSVIGAVIGEWVGASEGLGYFMVRSQSQFQTGRVFAAVVVLSIMGIALFWLAALAERRLIPWHHDRRGSAARWKEGRGSAL